MDYIYKAMGWIFRMLYEGLSSVWSPLGNYAIVIVAFTILIKLALLPINFNQQKTTAKQMAVRPKLDRLKEKCGDDKQKYNIGMQELYKRENVKMMSGCLPQLIMLPILWGVWRAISGPLSYILMYSKDKVAEITSFVTSALGNGEKLSTGYPELDIIKHLQTWDSKISMDFFTKYPDLKAAIASLNFNLFGIDLTQTPKFTINFSTFNELWIIPLLSFATAMASSLIAMQNTKKTNPEAANTGCIMLAMPVFSLVIAFQVPGAVGFYWTCSNVVSTIIQIYMNKYRSPQRLIAKGQIEKVAERRKKEEELKLKTNKDMSEA